MGKEPLEQKQFKQNRSANDRTEELWRYTNMYHRAILGWKRY